ncbi:uncharacterized protein LOC134192047 [Corticium candelabrum]|uniref:uncharacterized protein LOC134192047 n=1 Tax=Corticium candelabrum TaxID=121492 RepID=UPI002E259C76|nr:uncharacterized protein LOC134192047 [Corticium candelabrum]
MDDQIEAASLLIPETAPCKLRRIVRPYPEFPSKRLVKKSDPKVVQYRRKGLEIYIQGLVEVLPVHQLVLEFLQLGDVSEEYDEIDYEEFASLRKSPARYTHFPVLRMCSYQPQRDASCDMKFEEPGFSDASTSAAAIEDAKSDVDLGDIVTKGVVWGLRNKAS